MHIKTSEQPTCNLGFGGYTCNWGVHLCALYDSEQERDDLVLNFHCCGNAHGDLQLHCAADRLRQDFVDRLALQCPDCARDLRDQRRFQLYAPEQLYYTGGTFSPRAIDARLTELYGASQAAGPRNLRVTGEMVWARDSIPGVEHLMVYEARLNRFLPGLPIAAICLYDLRQFPGSAIMQVLRTHPYVITGGVITENPYYQKPEDWLRRNAPEFLTM